MDNRIGAVTGSPTGIRLRWEAGLADTMRALRRSPWNEACDPLEGIILHESIPETSSAFECWLSGNSAHRRLRLARRLDLRERISARFFLQAMHLQPTSLMKESK